MAAKKNVMEKILELSGEFVMKQGGDWGHTDWEAFIRKAAKAGADTDDEAKRNLGNILEGAKFLYHRAGLEPEPKRARTKVKAKSATKKPANKKADEKKKAAEKKKGGK